MGAFTILKHLGYLIKVIGSLPELLTLIENLKTSLMTNDPHAWSQVEPKYLLLKELVQQGVEDFDIAELPTVTVTPPGASAPPVAVGANAEQVSALHQSVADAAGDAVHAAVAIAVPAAIAAAMPPPVNAVSGN